MRYWRTAGAVSQSVGDELLLLEQQAGNLHHLNATAAWIYARCDGATLESLARALVEHFEIDADTAARDVATVIERLVALGLIRSEDGD